MIPLFTMVPTIPWPLWSSYGSYPGSYHLYHGLLPWLHGSHCAPGQPKTEQLQLSKVLVLLAFAECSAGAEVGLGRGGSQRADARCRTAGGTKVGDGWELATKVVLDVQLGLVRHGYARTKVVEVTPIAMLSSQLLGMYIQVPTMFQLSINNGFCG